MRYVANGPASLDTARYANLNRLYAERLRLMNVLKDVEETRLRKGPRGPEADTLLEGDQAFP